jgi:autotransporter-associated beta strand protein
VSSGRLNATGVSDSIGSGLGMGTQVELGQNANLQVTVGSGATNTTTRSLIANGSSFTLGNGGAGSLVWNGNTTFNSAVASGINFNSTGAGTNVFGGIIGNTTNNSAVNLNFQATQTWRLTGSNTFSGGITIGGGRVIADKLANIGTASSIGTAGNIRFGYFDNAPSTFEYVGSGSTNNMQIKLGASPGSNNNIASFLHNGTGVLMLTNTAFTLTSDVATTNINRVLVIGGMNGLDNAITGVIGNNTGGANSNSTVSLVKSDSGKWILGGNNTYTGGTVISNGILQIGNGGSSGSVLGAITNNGTLILSRSGNPTISNVISGSGAVLIASNASITLSGASTFAGKVTVAGSSALYAMGVADSGVSALGTKNQVELGSDPNSSRAALYVNVAAGTTNTTARELIANGPSLTLGNFSNGVLVWNGNTTFNRGTNSSFTFALGGSGTSTNVFAGMIGDTALDEWETTAPVNVTMTSASIWSLRGSNTFSGGVTLNDGKLVVSSLASNGSIGSGNFRMGGFANVPVLEYVGSGDTNSKQMRLGAGPAATGGRILNNGTGALVFTNANFISGADIQTAGLDRAIIFGGTNIADNAITGVIANVNSTNTVSIIKDDAGKWVFSGNNTYTGGTTISNGTFQIGAGGISGSVIGAITNNAALIYNRSDNTIMANVISGTGSFTKSGSGLLTLVSSNTYTGPTIVQSGTLLVATNSSIKGVATVGGGTLLVDGTAGNVIVNSGTATVNSNGTIGGTIINGSLLTMNGSAGDVLVNSGGTLGGSGSVQGLTLNGGTVAPGNSPGLLSAYELNGSNGTFQFQLGAPTTRGTTYDAINVTTLLTLGASTAFTFETLNSYTYAIGDTYDLFNFNSIDASAFDNAILLAALPDLDTINSNLKWSVTNFTTDGIVNVIPEPSTMSLLLGGVAGLIALKVMRKTKIK